MLRVHAALDNNDIAAIYTGRALELIPLNIINYRQPGTGETVFHKIAKLPYSYKLLRLLYICDKPGRDDIFLSDNNCASPMLVAVCHNRIWFLDYMRERRSYDFCVWKTPYRNLSVEPVTRNTCHKREPVTCNGISFTAGSTLLHAAVRANKPDVIKLLLEYPDGILHKDADGRNAIVLALTFRDVAPDVLDAFTSNDAILHRYIWPFYNII